jgi:ssDNA-binding Zn-finger/Zn-ribbon topoisomerase 1
MSEWTRNVSVRLPEDDDGFLQRSCPNCELLFAVHSEDYSDARLVNLRCPRCQFVEPFDTFATPQQRAFAEAHAQDALSQMAEEALNKVPRDLFKSLKSSKHVKISGPKGRITLPGTPVPSALAEATMTTQQCGHCGFRFKTAKADAIACPVCR